MSLTHRSVQKFKLSYLYRGLLGRSIQNGRGSSKCCIVGFHLNPVRRNPMITSHRYVCDMSSDGGEPYDRGNVNESMEKLEGNDASRRSRECATSSHEGAEINLKSSEIPEEKELIEDTNNEKHGVSIVDMTQGVLIDSDQFSRLPAKCSSCGAIFQKSMPKLPGYLTHEKFLKLKIDHNEQNYKSVRGEQTIICQPCFSLRHQNKVMIKPQDKAGALRQLTHISKRRALILYVVDCFDMLGSVVSDLASIVGEQNKVILVGNKIDKFPTGTYTTGGRQMNALSKMLEKTVSQLSNGTLNIVDTCLISSVNGYGFENLLVSLKKHRSFRDHIYIVGSNNSGKSSLFNLFQNLINVNVTNKPLPPQAIAHYLPGSTYGLLRHPIGQYYIQKLRTDLMMSLKDSVDTESEPLGLADELLEELGLENSESHQKRKQKQMTMEAMKESSETEDKELTIFQPEIVEKRKRGRRRNSYIYDTPGITNNNQLLQFLTLEEIRFLRQTLWIVPVTRLLHPGQILLIGGIARLDFVGISRPSKENPEVFEDVPKASQSIFFTCFFPRTLPVHITNNDRVELVYEKNLGGDLLKVPFGDKERLEAFPKLESKDYKLVGTGWRASVSDVVFNGLGWISVTAGYMSHVSLKVHTPLAVGQCLREDAIIPEAITRRGERGARYLGRSNQQIYQSTRTRNPALTEHLDERNKNVVALLKRVKEKAKTDRLFIREEQKRRLLEQGVVLGAFKRVGKLEKLLQEQKRTAIEGNVSEGNDNTES